MALRDDYGGRNTYLGEAPAGSGGGWLGGLLGGGGGGNALDIYGDLFTPEQKAALQRREMTQGLFRMAEKLGALAQPSRAPPGIGGTLGALGAGLGAFGGGTGEETALKGMQTAELVRAAKQKRELAAKVIPFFWKVAGGGVVQSPSDTPPAPGAVPLGPAPGATAPPAAAPAAPGMPPGAPAASSNAPPPPPGAPPVPAGDFGAGGEYGAGQLPAALQQHTGLLPPPPGVPDQVVGPDGQPLTGGGIFPSMLASYTGGMPGGQPPFRLAAAGRPPGAAGEADILDSVVAPLESGNRNIKQQVVGPQGGYNPSVGRVTGPSSAQGYYQITTPTWQDTAPKAGIDLGRYPTAMSAPRDVQKQVAQKLMDERGLQPWADYNPAVAAATGYRRGGRFAGAGPDAGRIPAGGGGQMEAISALRQLVGGGDDEEDPLALLANMTSGGAPDTVLPREGGGSDLPVRQATAALAPYATGNARIGQPSSVAGVGPDMSGKIERMVQAMPPKVRERFLITSGFRDAEQQRRVNPGVTNSRHMHGAAVDLAKDPVVLDWINKNPQYGLGFPLSADPRETNHLEMIDPASGGRLPIMRAQYSPGGGAAPGGTAASAAGGTIPGLNMTPQQLGAFNALFEMSGLGDPFKSLLETYYKSPGYLGEAAAAQERAKAGVQLTEGPKIKAAETIAELEAQIKLKPQLEAAIEQAKIDPKLSYDERKSLIDRESKRLEQIQAAMTTSREVVITPPGGTPRKLTLTNEQILRLNQGKPLPEIGLPAMSAVQLGEEVLTKQQEVDITSRGAAQTEMYKAGQKALDTAHDAVRGANQRAPYYGSMLTAMQGFQPGATAEMRLTAMQYLKDAGVIKGTNVSQGEALKLASERLAFLAVPSGQGSWAIVERQMLKNSIPGMALTPEGLTDAIRLMQQLDDYDRKVSEIHRQVADKNQGLPNLLEAQRRVEALGAPLTAQQEAALQALQQPTSAAPAPPGAPAGTLAAPPVGTIRNGYSFKGGNPNDQNSWQKVAQ